MSRARRLICLVAAAAVGSVTPALGAPTIAIDPGHGGADSGAVGVLPAGTVTGLPVRTDPASGGTRIYESDVNLDVANRVSAYLRARGYGVVMTRTKDLAGGDKPFTTVLDDLQSRVDVAEAAKAALFVSLHENSLTGTTSGTETYHYYYASENAKLLAELIQTNLVSALGLPDRGVQSAGFYVLRKTTMPAVLVEGMFLSNPNEALLLADPAVRQRIAAAVGAGVVTYYAKGYDKIVPTPTPIDTTPRYQVNVGTYLKGTSALARYHAVRRKHYIVAIRRQFSARHNRYVFVVVSGGFVKLDNARALAAKMRTSGLSAFVTRLAARSTLVRA